MTAFGSRRGGLGLVLLGMLAGCHEMEPSDAQRLSRLERRYSTQVRFSTSENLYLLARPRPGRFLDRARSEELFRQFFFDGASPRETSFVYLDVYASDGSFLDQLYFDPASGRILHERVEFH